MRIRCGYNVPDLDTTFGLIPKKMCPLQEGTHASIDSTGNYSLNKEKRLFYSNTFPYMINSLEHCYSHVIKKNLGYFQKAKKIRNMLICIHIGYTMLGLKTLATISKKVMFKNNRYS